jgi:hypothetical protein
MTLTDWDTGTAVWAVRKDGKLCHNWIERSSFELFQQLRNSGSTPGGILIGLHAETGACSSFDGCLLPCPEID